MGANSGVNPYNPFCSATSATAADASVGLDLLNDPPPIPEREPIEYISEEPTGLLNRYGRPIYRVVRVKV